MNRQDATGVRFTAKAPPGVRFFSPGGRTPPGGMRIAEWEDELATGWTGWTGISECGMRRSDRMDRMDILDRINRINRMDTRSIFNLPRAAAY